MNPDAPARPRSRRLVAWLLVGWCALCGEGLSFAGSRLPLEFSLRRWASTEDRPISAVEAITQTRDGFLWFAMNSGLGRFDGISMEVFGTYNTEAIKVSYATSLAEAPDGRLWVGTAGGGLLRFWQGHFDRFGESEGLTNEQVKALSLGPDGRLWIGTDGGGVFVRNTNGQFQAFSTAHGLPGMHIAAIQHDPQGRVVVLSSTEGPFRWNGERFEPVATVPATELRPRRSLVRGASGRLWLGGAQGIFYSDGDVFREWEPVRTLASERPLVAWEIRTNEFWLGSEQSLIHWKDTNWSVYPTGATVLNRSIGGFAVDHEGSVWISAEGRGLVQIRRTPLSTIGTDEGLPTDEITSVLSARDGALWVATPEGLARFDTEGTRRFSAEDGLLDKVLYSVQQDSRGTVWVGSRFGRLFQWDGERFTTHTPEIPQPRRAIWCLAPGADSTLWAGSSRGAIQYRDGRELRVVSKEQGLSNDDVRSIWDDGKGTVWMGTSYGLNRLNGTNVTVFTTVTNVEAPIEVVIALHPDSEGGLWIGTMARGLFLYQEGRFRHFSTADGLPSDSINSIQEDRYGNLWLGTGRGLARLSRDNLRGVLSGRVPGLAVHVMDRRDGLRTDEFTGTLQPTSARDAEGRLWFATSAGLSTVDPSRLFANVKAPRISIERIGLEGAERYTHLRGTTANSGQPVVIGPTTEFGHTPAPAGPRRSVFSPYGLSEVRIHPGHERLDFQYVGLSFLAPRAVTYRYRLDGFDSDWVEAGSQRAAYYTKVPPGRYLFRVQARNEDGVLGEPGAALAVVLEPRWWETSAFRIFGSIALLASMGLAYQLIVRAVRRRSEASNRLSRQLLRSQELERARLAGELHDGLGQELQLIRNRAEMALRRHTPSPDLTRELTSISETASRAIGGVRALSRGLRPPELDQLGLTQALRWLAQNVAESYSGRLEFQVDSVDGLLPRQLEVDVYRIAQEALNNAVKHSEASEITFEVVRNDDSMQVSVFDNGRGFATHIQSDGSPHGYGLTTMRERAAMLQGELELRSEGSVGTRLTLQVPVPEKKALTR